VNPFAPDKSSTLVIDGIYRYTRNPMYLGLALLLVALAAFLGNAWSATVVPAYVWYMTQFQIKPEERALLEKFGSEFRAYTNSARRWL
jgi:protein-S-isoprenylcysteine O-methyltransferase Ste14